MQRFLQFYTRLIEFKQLENLLNIIDFTQLKIINLTITVVNITGHEMFLKLLPSKEKLKIM